MKTNEIEKMLGITKETLRYYEKEQLIKPARNQNGYRNYNEEDIRLLKVILLLRSLEISIDDIKLILNNQLSLNECLKVKKDHIENDIKDKQEVISKIDKNLSRKKAYFGYQTIPLEKDNEVYICFQNHQLIIHDPYDIQFKDYKEYSYHQIQQIDISLCTRAFQQNISQDGKLKMPQYYLAYGLATLCFIDLNIKTDDNCYQFESTSLQNIKDIFYLLQQKDIVIYDPLGLMNIFQQNSDEETLRKTLFQHLKEWEKAYHIDNPRSIETYQQIEKFQDNIKKKDVYLDNYVGMIPRKLFYALVITFIFILVLTILIAFNS